MVITIICIVLSIPIIMGIAQYIKNPRPPNGLNYEQLREYYFNKEWENTADDMEDLEAINKTERIAFLDETLIKYTKLLDNLEEQYKNTYNEKEKSRILAKQIVILEKFNKALEKRERLE